MEALKAKPNKKVFNLEDKKLFSMQITNYGTKELFLPEWFRNNKDYNNVEMSFEIYKKEKNKYVKYVQKRMKTKEGKCSLFCEEDGSLSSCSYTHCTKALQGNEGRGFSLHRVNEDEARRERSM